LEWGEGRVADVIVGFSCEIVELDICFRELDESDISVNFWVNVMTSIGIVRILNKEIFNDILRTCVHTSYGNSDNTVFVEVSLIGKEVVVLALFDCKRFRHEYGQEPISIFRDVSKANTSRDDGGASFAAQLAEQETARANTRGGVGHPDQEFAVAGNSGELLIWDLNFRKHKTNDNVVVFTCWRLRRCMKLRDFLEMCYRNTLHLLGTYQLC